MPSSPSRLEKVAGFGVLVWFAVQIIFIALFWNTPQGSDPKLYMDIALRCFDSHEWYPMKSDVFSLYIWAPGLINFLILQLHVFGTMKANMILNLLMNLAILIEVCYLANRFFGRPTGATAALLWILMYSNLFAVLPTGTEVPFLFLALTGLCIGISDRMYLVILAGILIALANWIRPLVIVFIPAILYFQIIQKRRFSYALSMLATILAITVFIGYSTQKKIDYFVYQSSTTGANLIMTANDRAYGGVATSILFDSTSTAFIPNTPKITFLARDSIWRSMAKNWIAQNPGLYVKLYLLKTIGLFSEDSWADRPILGGSAFVSSYMVDKNVSRTAFYTRALQMGLKSLTYYLSIAFFLLSLYQLRKSWRVDYFVLLSILFFGTAITCLFSVTPRYHYPLMFVIIIFAATSVQRLIPLQHRSTVQP